MNFVHVDQREIVIAFGLQEHTSCVRNNLNHSSDVKGEDAKVLLWKKGLSCDTRRWSRAGICRQSHHWSHVDITAARAFYRFDPSP
ncbi:hypothetical protein JTE90_007024 [Oedothorax gibbosus]|uniref:Uncharacterized protein n=1 Tax=Oedothorax gibbosus TaxID=931172 RepID=A0AAV6U7N0_9ARAC|nr:hypothetical protein JTE90_007024 [Oedothorax gibbosus]